MTRQDLIALINSRRTPLCVGLDPDLEKIPTHLLGYDNPIWEFNKAIIDATRDYCVAYKPNIAFYEAHGIKGWQALEKTIQYIGKEHFIIADAKRGDIGNTSRLYAKAFFETLDCDAITVAPYMGEDSVLPFLGFKDKWVIVLALTSNAGSQDFQFTTQENGEPLYEKVMRRVMTWGNPDNTMFVCGATHPERFADLRTIAPDNFFLVPGVGAQGGDYQSVIKHGSTADGTGLLINSAREIIYASKGEDFAEQATLVAKRYLIQ